jgi:hypothetical protein
MEESERSFCLQTLNKLEDGLESPKFSVAMLRQSGVEGSHRVRIRALRSASLLTDSSSPGLSGLQWSQAYLYIRHNILLTGLLTCTVSKAERAVRPTYTNLTGNN